MKADLQEHLTEAYEVDVDIQIALAEGSYVQPNVPSRHQDRFIIDDEDKANWALRKLAKIKAARDAAMEQARIEHDRIAAWLDQRLAQVEREGDFFEGLLEQFHRNQLSADPKRKTISLPAGTLRARKRPDSVEIDDTDAFIEWARSQRPEFVRVKYAVEKAVVKNAAIKDGEVLPHVVIEPAGIGYTVEVGS